MSSEGSGRYQDTAHSHKGSSYKKGSSSKQKTNPPYYGSTTATPTSYQCSSNTTSRDAHFTQQQFTTFSSPYCHYDTQSSYCSAPFNVEKSSPFSPFEHKSVCIHGDTWPSITHYVESRKFIAKLQDAATIFKWCRTPEDAEHVSELLCAGIDPRWNED